MGTPKIKSRPCSKVLQLMDQGYTYTEALKLVLGENTSLNRDELETELDHWI